MSRHVGPVQQGVLSNLRHGRSCHAPTFPTVTSGCHRPCQPSIPSVPSTPTTPTTQTIIQPIYMPSYLGGWGGNSGYSFNFNSSVSVDAGVGNWGFGNNWGWGNGFNMFGNNYFNPYGFNTGFGFNYWC